MLRAQPEGVQGLAINQHLIGIRPGRAGDLSQRDTVAAGAELAGQDRMADVG